MSEQLPQLQTCDTVHRVLFPINSVEILAQDYELPYRSGTCLGPTGVPGRKGAAGVPGRPGDAGATGATGLQVIRRRVARQTSCPGKLQLSTKQPP